MFNFRYKMTSMLCYANSNITWFDWTLSHPRKNVKNCGQYKVGVYYQWIWLLFTIKVQGVQEKVKKSNHLVWYKNKVEFLFLAHQLRGNMCPFCLITQTKPLCLLFWSKISMQKNHRNAKKCHFRPILANWLYQKGFLRAF